MRIIVVEPHADDAFLSVGWHLQKLWEGIDKTIITVFSDPRRTKEANSYAEAVGATSVVLGLAEAKMLSGEKSRAIQPLREWLNENLQESDQVYFPLGLQHPDHISVALTRPAGAYRYLDTPYQAKLKLSEELLKKAPGMSIQSICFPPKNKWKHIPLFKSQAKFFHFNQDLKESKLPEIILCRS